MADKSIIAWTKHTWNPWMGCQRVSQGCTHCYAETLTKNRMGIEVFGSKGLRRRTGKAVWARPRMWNRDAEAVHKPARTFCASLADFFEDADGPNEWRDEAWEIIRATPWLDWQLLTKRPENIAGMLPADWGQGWPNVWLGTSIEDNRVVERAPILTAVPAIVHFVSYEPAIGPVDQLDLSGVEWLIAGGESGPGYRPMNLDWVRDVRHRCDRDGVAFFFKQDSGYRTELGIDALGEIVREYPKNWNRAKLTARAVAAMFDVPESFVG